MDIVFALDIGTDIVKVVVAKAYKNGELEILGVGTVKSEGVKSGVIVNIHKTTNSIQKALDLAEKQAGVNAKEVVVAIAGEHIKSFQSDGVVAIKNGIVTEEDVDRVIEAASTIKIDESDRIIHVIPQKFIIDGQDNIVEPVGMHGVRLEVEIHVITAKENIISNLKQCLSNCSLDLKKIVLSQIAASESVLFKDEMDLGICLIDIGGGTCDISVFKEGVLTYNSVYPVGGRQVTLDITSQIAAPMDEAERIKIAYGSVISQFIADADDIQVRSVGNRPPRFLSANVLSDYIGVRYEEILKHIRYKLEEESSCLKDLAAGIVLTGNAASVLGLVELAEEVFHKPVRIGKPIDLIGLKDKCSGAEFSVATGLIRYDALNLKDYSFTSSLSKVPVLLGSKLKGLFKAIKNVY